MNRIVNVADLSSAVSQLVDRAAAGQDVVLERGGQPVARLVGVVRPAAERRGLGVMKGVGGPQREGAFDPLSGDEPTLWRADSPPKLK